MHILCLIDFHPGSHSWLWEHQAEPKDQVDFLIAPFQGVLNHIPKPLAYAIGSGLQALLAVLRISTRRYDLVVAWEGKNGLPFALLKRLFGLRIPRLVILAFSERGLLARRPGLLGWILQAADRLVFVSAFDARASTRRLGLTPQKAWVCKIGQYDTQYLVEDAHAQLEPPAPLKIFSGGHSNRDFNVLLQAACKLPVTVQMVGAQPTRLAVDDPRLANFHWTRRLSADEYLYQLANADIVVIPLQTGGYTAGLVDLIYAMACSRPVVASDAAGIGEYLQDGETGLLVKPGDAGALKAALERLISQPQERIRLGANARRAYLAEYSLESFAGRVFPILSEAAG